MRGILATVVAASIAMALAGSQASAGSADGAVKQGGTLRINMSDVDFDYLDPALSYDAAGWKVLYSTSLYLLNYPDAPAPRGNRPVPDGASALPTVSRDGRSYTFRIRRGLRFSDGSAVTAGAFKRAFERAADPRQESPAVAFMHNIVGADARAEGKASDVSGVSAKGMTLTVRLVTPDPTFLAQVAMPFFVAVKPSTPIDRHGIEVYPSAGPYSITAREVGRQLVLDRNRFYRGSRPRNADRIVISVLTDKVTSFLETKAGKVDVDLGGLPPSAHAELLERYGVNKGRYFVYPQLELTYIALNTSRPVFSKSKLRQAVNYAIDRPALARVGGKLCCRRTDQILPPGVPGYRDEKIYPIKGADPERARRLAGGADDVVILLHTAGRQTSFARAAIVQYNLRQIGLRPQVRSLPFSLAHSTAAKKGAEFDLFMTAWLADYLDPYDFVNVLLDGDSIADDHNLNYSYFDSPRFNGLMHEAAKLSGEPRYDLYRRLDIDITKAAPIVALSNDNYRAFIGPRVTNYIPHPLYGGILNALALK